MCFLPGNYFKKYSYIYKKEKFKSWHELKQKSNVFDFMEYEYLIVKKHYLNCLNFKIK